MSQLRSTHAALHVPEILVSIGHHLPREDFLRAVLVCKSWHTILVPLLWHTLTIPHHWRLKMMEHNDTFIGFPDPSIFKAYAHLVRSLNCNNIDYHLHYLVPGCNQLTELEVVDLSMGTLPLLKLNTATLTSIKFKREHDELLRMKPFGILEFLKAMNECPFLDQLWLEDFEVERPPIDKRSHRGSATQRRRTQHAAEGGEIFRSPEDLAASITVFYEIVQRLSRLDLVRNVILTPPPSRSQVFYRLRRLALLGCTMSYRDQLQLVSQCQYLTHLRLEFKRDSEHLDPEELALIELDVNCPRITHLDLSWSTLQDQEIATLLRYIPRLISFRAQRTNVGEKTIQLLTGIHSKVKDQLWELDLVDARIMQSPWIQQLLCSCSGLRRFRATEMNAREIVNAAVTRALADPVPGSTESSSSSLSSSGSWVCLQLQELQLSISGIPPRSSFQDHILVYDQLSKLTQLQILSLGGNCMSTWFRMQTLRLSLQNGFDQLSTLKELRMFNFSYMDHDLGMAEVEFMMEHWKKLRKVIGTVAIGPGYSEMGTKGTGGGTGSGSGRQPKVERHEIYIHRKWPLVQFCSR